MQLDDEDEDEDDTKQLTEAKENAAFDAAEPKQETKYEEYTETKDHVIKYTDYRNCRNYFPYIFSALGRYGSRSYS